jgi:dihydroorotase/N-acyl-D-amino-acid deacylase
VPGTFTPTEEVIELAKVAGRMGGIYISHMRDETNGVLDSVRETIAIGEKGGLPTQVTHHKIIGKANWGRAVDTLKLIDEARARGVDATHRPVSLHGLGDQHSGGAHARVRARGRTRGRC